VESNASAELKGLDHDGLVAEDSIPFCGRALFNDANPHSFAKLALEDTTPALII
jgi:hypothetical protein